jgi:hypothetical protein
MHKDLALRQKRMLDRMLRENDQNAKGDDKNPASDVFERHFTIREIAERLNMSCYKVANLFIDEPGVVKTGRPRGFNKAGKRHYLILRVPESVARRVYLKLQRRSPEFDINWK